jgi:hypothetical protein
MTGTNLSAIVPPIVAMISLAVWLAMVFYADAHPAVRRQAPAKPGPEPAMRAPADSGGKLAARPGARRPDLARR